jgi:hypothetical protein
MAEGSKEKKEAKIREIEVIDAKRTEVELKIRNVHCVFRQNGKRIRLVAKFDPRAYVYDPADLWIGPELFKKACRQAAQILKEKQLAAGKRKKTTLKNELQGKLMLGIKGGNNEKESDLSLVR